MMIRDKRILLILKRINKLSDKYHKMSLLFYELSKSLELQVKQGKKYKEIQEMINNLDLDAVKDLIVSTIKINNVN